MGASLAATLLVGATLATPSVWTGVRAEAAAGVAPVSPSAPSEPAIAVTLTPKLTLGIREPRSVTFATYGPRIFWRQPNLGGLERPILLHDGIVGHRARVTRRLSLRESIDARYGELDYTSAALALSPGQTSQVDVSLLNYYDVVGEVGATSRTSQRTTLDVPVRAGESGSTNSSFLPRHRYLLVAPTLTVDASRRDDLSFPVTAEVHAFDDRQLVSESAGIELRHAATRRTSILGGGGVRHEASLDRQAHYFYPMARAGTRIAVARNARASAIATLAPTLDTIRGTYTSYAGIETGMVVALDRQWAAGARVTGLTSVAAALDPPQAETVVAVEVPFIVRLDRSLALEFGLRHAFRAPHFGNAGSIEQVQTWAFAALRWEDGIGPPIEDPPLTPVERAVTAIGLP